MTARKQSTSTKCGSLKKYLGVFEGWQMGYFRLDRCYLHYFRHKEAATPVESLTRGDITVACPTTMGRFSNMSNIFKVETKSGKSWQLQASSLEEMNQWVQAITSSRKSLLPSQASQGTTGSPSQTVASRTNQREPASWSTACLSTPGPHTMGNRTGSEEESQGHVTNVQHRITRTVSPPPPYTEYDYYNPPAASSCPDESTAQSGEGMAGAQRTEYCAVS